MNVWLSVFQLNADPIIGVHMTEAQAESRLKELVKENIKSYRDSGVIDREQKKALDNIINSNFFVAFQYLCDIIALDAFRNKEENYFNVSDASCCKTDSAPIEGHVLGDK